MASPSPLSPRFVPYWTPEIGQRAAQLQGRAMRCVGVAGLLVAPVAFVFGTAMDSTDIAYRTVGWVVLSLDIVLIAAGIVTLELAAKAMSRHYGIRVGVITGPTFRDDRFNEWKQRRGLGELRSPGHH
jgi:hypothetical protein